MATRFLTNLDIFETPKWHLDAACLPHRDLFQGLIRIDTFVGPTDEDYLKARAICKGCPVRIDCATAGATFATPHIRGVWGGMTPAELKKFKREHKVPTHNKRIRVNRPLKGVPLATSYVR